MLNSFYTQVFANFSGEVIVDFSRPGNEGNNAGNGFKPFSILYRFILVD